MTISFDVLHSQVVKLTELGKSHENRRIVMVKIGRYFSGLKLANCETQRLTDQKLSSSIFTCRCLSVRPAW